MNDPFWAFVITIVSFACVALLAFGIYYRTATNAKLKKHIDEWLVIKAKTIALYPETIRKQQPWAVVDAVRDAYYGYIDELAARERGTLTGACFPPIGNITMFAEEGKEE